MTTPRVVLASGSPRRKVLLHLLLDDFEVVVPDVDESFPPGRVATAMEEVAARKAATVATHDAVVVAADTAVLRCDRVLGKPADRDEAGRMLRSLQDRDHDVVTAVAVHGPTGQARFHVVTRVRLSLPSPVLDDYLRSGRWQGKAGAYGVQDPTIAGHVHLDGPWSNVVGLPLHAVHQALLDQGVACRHPPPETVVAAQNPF